MTTLWRFAQNPFDNATKENFRLMHVIVGDHDARLENENSDPDIMTIYNETHPVIVIFNDSYSGWFGAKGSYKGETARVDALLEDLSSNKIREFDVKIQIVFPERSPDYLVLLPNERAPFQSGGKDERINAVKTLDESLVAYPALAALKVEVNAFYTLLKDARDIQQQKEMGVTTKSSELEISRKQVASVMFGGLGKLMHKYRNDPAQIQRFWQMSLLRDTGRDLVLLDDFAGANTENVLSGGFDDETQFEFSDPGNTRIKYFVTDSATGLNGGGVELNPGETIVKKASEIGPAGSRFLNVTNLDPVNEGKWRVKML